MQWSQIKTLFILCFLVLDVYLLIQFFDKQEKSDLDVMKEQDASIEKQLKVEDIKLPKLPDKEIKQSYISVEQKDLSDLDSYDEISSSDNQKMTTVNDKLLVSTFEKPISVEDSDDVKETVEKNVLSGDEYSYWDWNEDLNTIIFFQEKNDQPVYYNDKGLLLLYLNNDDEIVGYTQTMLGEENEDFDTKKRPLIKPIRAIDTLYNQYELRSGDEIAEPTIGYYTSQPIDSDEQTLAPTWRIMVKGEHDRNYFVHAVEGSVFPHDDVTFLKDSLQTINSSLSTVKGDKSFKKISRYIDKRLETIEQEEDEDE